MLNLFNPEVLRRFPIRLTVAQRSLIGLVVGAWLWMGLGLTWAAEVESSGAVTLVDVMILYTSQARDGAGGTAAMRSQIEQAFVEANTVFQNSRVDTRLRVAHLAEVTYTESGTVSNDLARLRAPVDGFLDEAHTLRDLYRADLVCLVTETGSDWEFYGLQGPSAANAFSVLRRPFLSGRNDLPVVLSFNFGCQLERSYADSEAAYPYAYGYSFRGTNGNAYSTVEAFSGQRLPFFSNPDMVVDGTSAGVPVGLPDAANNALVLRRTTPLVAAFRGPAPRTAPPRVTLTLPASNAVIAPSSAVEMAASVSDADGLVARVKFFADSRLLGEVLSPPFAFVWTNRIPGVHRFTAMAVDDQGAVSVSEPVDAVILPVNDDFARRAALVGTNVIVDADNRLALAEAGDPDLDSLTSYPPARKTLWWTWTAPAEGVVSASLTERAEEMLLAAYDGTDLTTLQLLAGAENKIRLPVQPGQTLQLVTDGISYFGVPAQGGPFQLELVISPKPANDDFLQATPIVGSRLTVDADARAASLEPGEPDHGFDQSGGHSTWWRWTAPTNGQVRVTTTTDDTFDFQGVVVYLGDTLWDLTNVSGGPSEYVVFQAAAGGTYHLAADGSGGPFTLSFELLARPGNDAFADAIRIDGNSAVLPASNFGATTEPGEPGHNQSLFPNDTEWQPAGSVWWKWRAPAAGKVSADAGYAYPWGGNPSYAVVSMYEGSSVDSLTRVTDLETVPGTDYYIAVDSSDGRPADYTLNFQFTPRAPNDHFADRFPLSGELLNVRGSNHFATGEPDEPARGPAGAARSVWWSWTAPRDGVVTMQGYAVGDRTVPEMAVYTGDAVAHLSLVASNFASPSLLSVLTFIARQDTTYQIALDGEGGQQGELGFTLDLANFRITRPLDGVRISNPAKVVVAADTEGIRAPFDRVEFLAKSLLYQSTTFVGTATHPPYEVAWTDALFLGSYELTAKAFRSNDLVLATPPARIYLTPTNDDFANAISLEGVTLCFSGSTSGATVEQGEPELSSSAAPQSIWWRWIAPTDGIVEAFFDTVSYDTSAEVYQGLDVAHLTRVGRVGQALLRQPPFPVAGGSTNYFAMHGPNGFGPARLCLNFAPLPPADDFANASLIASTPYEVTYASVAATREPGEPTHGGLTNGQHSAWWKWIAPADGLAFP